MFFHVFTVTITTADEHLILTGEIDKDHFLAYTVSGSNFNRDLAKIRMKTKKQILASERLQLLLKNNGGKGCKEQLQQELRDELSVTFNQLKQIELEYIKSNLATDTKAKLSVKH